MQKNKCRKYRKYRKINIEIIENIAKYKKYKKINIENYRKYRKYRKYSQQKLTPVIILLRDRATLDHRLRYTSVDNVARNSESSRLRG